MSAVDKIERVIPPFVIPKGFEKVILVLAGMKIQCLLAAGGVGKVRKQIFNQEFMEKNFGDVHQRELGEKIPAGGYPDTGSGLYSAKLSYRDWYRFNVAQRIHINYVENMSLASIGVIAGGLACPDVGLGVGIAHILGRLLISLFYKREGGAKNPLRGLGVMITHLATLTGLGFFIKHYFIDA